MSEATKPSAAKGSDWTRLLTDPDLVSHLGRLLQTYREVAPEMREAALLKAMREIKEAAVKARERANPAPRPSDHEPVHEMERVTEPALPQPEPIDQAPPFELDLFSPQVGLDRRRHQRIKCFFAVEIHVEGMETPVWGNLSNVSRGGCLVETASAVPAGKTLEIGLWVASGKIWVKGVILSGVVTRTAPSFGVRVRFSEAELAEKEHLREFLKFVESATRKAQSGHAYVAKLKV
ncbi:MAG TPA: PilZ domain-containing protein [Terriglobales bacterium]